MRLFFKFQDRVCNVALRYDQPCRLPFCGQYSQTLAIHSAATKPARFSRENTQKGRYREFFSVMPHLWNDSPMADAELFALFLEYLSPIGFPAAKASLTTPILKDYPYDRCSIDKLEKWEKCGAEMVKKGISAIKHAKVLIRRAKSAAK